jgi:type 1 fimbria pilin
MRFNLRNLVLASASIAAFTATAAMAETTLKVPFNFTVAGKNCPAGVYTVERNSVGTQVTLKSMSAPKSFTWAVGPGDPAPTETGVVLKFDARGQDHALQSIQYGSKVTSNLDNNNRSERRQPLRIALGE